jgi:N-acetylmuramoyl-L-alanine amidase
MRLLTMLMLSIYLLSALSKQAHATDDGEVVLDTTADFNKRAEQAEQRLAKAEFFSNLQASPAAAKLVTAADIKSNVSIPNLGRGDPTKKYDAILQPGHYGRTSGATGGEGAQVTEQKLVAYIVANVAQYLIDLHSHILVIPADDFDKSGLNADVFLAIHADAAEKPCTTGPSLGYPKGANLLAMHSIGYALATAMGQTYSDFQKDNFTVNEYKYYAFQYIKTSGYSGLLEVGELTCPAKEKALIDRALLISRDLGIALKASIDIIKSN